MSQTVSHVSDVSFESEVLKSSEPVLVDFWAEWCGPCKSIAPMLDQLANDYQGRMKIVKVNVDQNQKTMLNYKVRSIPTLLIFKDGKVQATQVGAPSNKSLLANLIEKAL